MSKLLLDESPILVLPSLATKIGLNEAIFIQQLHYWLKDSKNVRDGRKWVYNTHEEWQEQFPFWSISTIRRTITKLEKANLIIVSNYNKMAIDKTKWYRINYDLLEEMSNPNQNKQPEEENSPTVQNEQSEEESNPSVQNEQSDSVNSPCVQNEQSSCSEWTALEVNLNTPITRDYTEITTENKKEVEEDAPARDQSENPFFFFENNGFGMISGYMSEKINTWCNDLSDELVLEAMKLAVENGSKKWNYVETILRTWADKKLDTIEKVHADQKSYREQQSKKRSQSSSGGYKLGRGNKPVRKELLPEWFEETEEEKVTRLADKEKSQKEQEITKQEIDEMLRKLRE
mgnify:CR=1 FL=1